MGDGDGRLGRRVLSGPGAWQQLAAGQQPSRVGGRLEEHVMLWWGSAATDGDGHEPFMAFGVEGLSRLSYEAGYGCSGEG